jgi:hypothetical protein
MVNIVIEASFDQQLNTCEKLETSKPGQRGQDLRRPSVVPWERDWIKFSRPCLYDHLSTEAPQGFHKHWLAWYLIVSFICVCHIWDESHEVNWFCLLVHLIIYIKTHTYGICLTLLSFSWVLKIANWSSTSYLSFQYSASITKQLVSVLYWFLWRAHIPAFFTQKDFLFPHWTCCDSALA